MGERGWGTGGRQSGWGWKLFVMRIEGKGIAQE